MLMEQENEAIKALEEQFNIEFQEWLERLAIKENVRQFILIIYLLSQY